MVAIETQRPPKVASKALQTLPLLLFVIVAVVAFIWLSNLAGTIAEVNIGFLFLWYWAGVQRTDLKELPSTAVGAAFGLGLAYTLYWLSHTYGAQGALGFGLLMIPIVWLQMISVFPFVINNAAMLMLTVAAISHMQKAGDFDLMFKSLGLGVVFFGALVWLAGMLTRKKA